MESGGKVRQHLARLFRSACSAAVQLVDYGGCRAQGKRRSSVWRGKERRVRETGGCYEASDWEGRMCPPAFSPSSNSPSRNSSYYHYYRFHGCALPVPEQVCSWRSGRTIEKSNAMQLRSDAYGFTGSSSSETDDGFFSSKEKKEESTTTTFFSSEFYASAKKSKKVAARRVSKRREAAAAYWPAGGCKGGGFHPLVAVVDGDKKRKKKNKQQREVLLAVEKLSRDPYKDFRRSMLDTIIQRQMFRPRDLERLLQSYLALNRSPLHPLILQAFSDIWVLLFHH